MPFNLKDNLGLSKVNETLIQAVTESLSSFSHELFPYGLNTVISELTVKKTAIFSKNKIELSFTLPFPCQWLHAKIIEHINNDLPELEINTLINTNIAPVFVHPLSTVKNLIVVSSGKGGVGKSTTTVNIAHALNKLGCKVGILDADVYGPSVPLLLSAEGKHPRSPDGVHLEPVISQGISAMSTGFLADDQEAKIWRGKVVSGAFEQMLTETLWGGLDYLLIDMPPGTGDIQLTLAQKVPAICSVIVTTPQDIALLDANKGIAMFEQVNIPILGMIENMSVHICPKCQQSSEIFGSGGAEQLAQAKQLPLLAKLPLDIGIREAADNGLPLKDTGVEQRIVESYQALASRITAELFYQHDSRSPKSGQAKQ